MIFLQTRALQLISLFAVVASLLLSRAHADTSADVGIKSGEYEFLEIDTARQCPAGLEVPYNECARAFVDDDIFTGQNGKKYSGAGSFYAGGWGWTPCGCFKWLRDTDMTAATLFSTRTSDCGIFSKNHHSQVICKAAPAAAWQKLGKDIDGVSLGDESGFSVSLSSDGETIAIGSPFNDGVSGQNTGHTRIYKWSLENTSWVKMGSDIAGDPAYDYSGSSVSLSSDGETIAIGSTGICELGENCRRREDGETGHTRIYKWSLENTSWVKMGSVIEGEADGEFSGSYVSLSSDGETIAISFTIGVKYTRIYRWSAVSQVKSSWVQMGSDIETNGWFSSASLSSDGNTIAISCTLGIGYTRIYRWLAVSQVKSSWVQMGSDIEWNSYNNGFVVSLSSDGETIAIGGKIYKNGKLSSITRIYKWFSEITFWVQMGSNIDGDAAYDYSGSSVSLSSDGETIAIGRRREDGETGHTRIYKWSLDNTSWVKMGSVIEGEADGEFSGSSVSLSSDGETIAIGSPGSRTGPNKSSHTRIYKWVGGAGEGHELGYLFIGEGGG